MISISRIQRPLKACFRLLYDDDDDDEDNLLKITIQFRSHTVPLTVIIIHRQRSGRNKDRPEKAPVLLLFVRHSCLCLYSSVHCIPCGLYHLWADRGPRILFTYFSKIIIIVDICGRGRGVNFLFLVIFQYCM